MARKLRIQYAGALYHVINRGNYRRDLFETTGAAEAFLTCLFEAAGKFGWRIHGYVLMRNHYHVALETVGPTLVEGMHWLQSTIATRFNRFRTEQGHLFQGRYKALVVEDWAAMAKVVDYIHLNPVRARVIPPEQITGYRWSSFFRLVRGPRPESLVATRWLEARGGWSDDPSGLQAYAGYLTQLAKDEADWEARGLTGLSCGWAIGTQGWRKALAATFRQMALEPGLELAEVRELRRQACESVLNDLLAEQRKTADDLRAAKGNAPWKIALAMELRARTGAPIGWLSEVLHMGKPATARSYLCRLRDKNKNQQTTA